MSAPSAELVTRLPYLDSGPDSGMVLVVVRNSASCST
jgi:hypothetical protein